MQSQRSVRYRERNVQRTRPHDYPCQGAPAALRESRLSGSGELEKRGLGTELKQAGVTREREVYFSEEMRLGLRGQVRRVLAPRGVKGVQRVQLTYKWVYLLLAVDPWAGKIRWAWVERMNAEHLLPMLQSWALPCVVWDGAPAHRAKTMQELDTVCVRQLAYSPEVNQAERIFEEVWRWSEGEVYANLEAKKEAAEIYLYFLDRNPDLVRQLCNWDWIRDTLHALPPAPKPPLRSVSLSRQLGMTHRTYRGRTVR